MQPQHRPHRSPASLPRLWLLALVALSLGVAAAPGAGRAEGLRHPSLLTNVSFEHLTLAGGGEASVSSPGLVADVGVGLPLSAQDHLAVLAVRAGIDDERDPRLATQLFLRTSAGFDRWTTFFDAGILARIRPAWSAGARLGIGLQRELSEHVGVFATAGGTAGYGDRFHVGFDGGIGLLFRFGSAGADPSIHWYEH